MKRTSIILVLMLLLTSSAFAQSTKRSGAKRLNIKEIVNGYLKEPEGELVGRVNDAWEKYLKGKPQDEGVKITLDSKNGYFRYDDNSPESNTYVEICYWNRNDGKQLIAWNSVIIEDGKPVFTECTYLDFSLYNPKKRQWEDVDEKAVGMNLSEKETGPSIYGYNSDLKSHFVTYSEEEKTIKMTKEEFEAWWEVRPLVIYELPRVGKDITVKIYEGKKITPITMKWNGLKFQKQ